MLTTLKQLSALVAPSGWEDAAGAYVAEKARSLGLAPEKDSLGNIHVKKPGAKSPARLVALTAYLDEPGMMLKTITEDGLFRFGLTGDTDPRTILGKTVLAGEHAHKGVVGRKPIHLTTPQERKTMPKTEELYLDLGALDQAQAETMAQPGDYAVFTPECLELGPYEILAKAMGRSVGCGVLLALMERELPVDVTFVFTAQRQVGSRGAMAAAARLRPGVSISLELCPANGEKQPKLGAGPVLPAVDQSAIYDRGLTELIKNAAPAALQSWGETENGGDGGVFQRAGGGARAAALCCPAKYLTGPYPVIDRRDYQALPEFLLAGLQALAAQPWL